MQNHVKASMPYRVEIDATAHAWMMPVVWVFEKLFRAGDAVRLGKTTLYVKDEKGSVIHQEYYGKGRKAAWYRQLEIEQRMKEMSATDFEKWLKGGK